ncbi:uncharacterized protein LOC103570089 isoform X2 [Microplitis demolitor]|uniref:uncharacterized protein LOC103570089 isoform X2 n=1 Tax=Microplitis demolitor TaxID=69319 RepID=UPI0004CCAB60|nr:uncharacterized protein LOC103570089 isoform X2 [Microplitis demolitor]
MFWKIQLLSTFIIFNNYCAASLDWPDISDVNSIDKFVQTFNSQIDNEFEVQSYMDEDYKNNVIKNFATEMLNIFHGFNKSDDYKSNFTWLDFENKLKNHRISKNSTLSLLPHIILESIKDELLTNENSTNNFFNNRIYNTINNIENICLFAANYSFFSFKSKYSYLKVLYTALTDEIDLWEVKSDSTDLDCDEHIFLQDLYDISREIIRGFFLRFFRMSIGLSLKSKCTNLNVTEKLIHEREYFMTDVKELMNFTQDYLGNYSEYIFSCDFDNHIRNKTYIELERMIQVVIHNEYYMDKAGSCSYNCDTKQMTLNSEMNEECMDISCNYMGKKLEVCELSDDVRRYQWFKDENNNVYGNNTNCKGKVEELYSWYQWTTRYCDFCVCTCTAKPRRLVHNEITALSFQDQTSDTDKNQIVVDLKFVVKNNTIYVDIKEGKLLPRGKIDKKSLVWKSLDNCTIFDDFTACKYPPKPGEATYIHLVARKDFGYPKILNLDDLIASTESVVTGVRFRYAGDLNTFPKFKNGSVELQIRVTDFNYESGKLSNTHHWISPDKNVTRVEIGKTR